MKRIHFKKTLKTHFKNNPFSAIVFSRPKSFIKNIYISIFSKFNWDFFLREEWNILELVISFFFNSKYIWILFLTICWDTIKNPILKCHLALLAYRYTVWSEGFLYNTSHSFSPRQLSMIFTYILRRKNIEYVCQAIKFNYT